MNRTSLALLLTALTLSTVSAYYSIVGLAAIFAASFWPVLILATTLEVGKLVLVSWLYRNWGQTPWPIRTYLTGAVIILMLITSLGIFGFLSQAHSQDQVQITQTQLQISQLNSQIQARDQQLSEARQTIEQLNRSINIQLDANRAQQALANRRTQQAERDRVQSRMDQLQTEIQQLIQQRTQIESTRTQQDSKLGPVRYVVALVSPDADPNQAVKWIILVLVLVCDPLAVLMLMAANQGYKNDTAPTSNNQGVRWNSELNCVQVQDHVGVWHVWNQTPAVATSPHTDVPNQVKLVEQTVTELLRQRPIFEMGVRPFDAPVSVSTNAPVDQDPAHLQKLIEQTLENWMNKTLTVTYSADQTEIDRIVEKVIARTTASSTPISPTESNATVDAAPESLTSAIPTQETTSQDAIIEQTATHVSTVHVTEPEPVKSSDTDESQSKNATNNRPIYNYFGEERVRGGKKHNITT